MDTLRGSAMLKLTNAGRPCARSHFDGLQTARTTAETVLLDQSIAGSESNGSSDRAGQGGCNQKLPIPTITKMPVECSSACFVTSNSRDGLKKTTGLDDRSRLGDFRIWLAKNIYFFAASFSKPDKMASSSFSPWAASIS